MIYRPSMTAKDSVDKTQEEIIKEMAKALGHSGYLLDTAIEELRQIEDQMTRTNNKEAINRLVERFNTKREEALFRRYMLIIHREALGVRQHKFLDKYYPIPDKKKKL